MMPEFAGLITAIAALLVIFGWSLIFSRTLQAIRPRVPVLFRPLVDALISADTAIYNALRGWADTATQPADALIQRVIASLDSLTSVPLGFARSVVGALGRLVDQAIPGGLGYVESLLGGVLAQAKGYADSLAQTAQQELAPLVALAASLPADLQNLYQQTVGYALSLAHEVQAYAQGLFATAEKDAAALVGQEAALARDAEQQITREVDDAAQALEAHLANEVAHFESQLGSVAQGLAADVANARHELEGALGDVEGKVAAAVQDAVLAFPNAMIHRISPDARKSLEDDVAAIATIALARIRAEAKDVEALRARFGPIIRQEIEKVRAQL